MKRIYLSASQLEKREGKIQLGSDSIFCRIGEAECIDFCFLRNKITARNVSQKEI